MQKLQKQRVTRLRLEKQLEEFLDTAPQKQKFEFVPTIFALAYGFVRNGLDVGVDGAVGEAYAQIANGLEMLMPELKTAHEA